MLYRNGCHIDSTVHMSRVYGCKCTRKRNRLVAVIAGSAWFFLAISSDCTAYEVVCLTGKRSQKCKAISKGAVIAFGPHLAYIYAISNVTITRQTDVVNTAT